MDKIDKQSRKTFQTGRDPIRERKEGEKKNTTLIVYLGMHLHYVTLCSKDFVILFMLFRGYYADNTINIFELNVKVSITIISIKC